MKRTTSLFVILAGAVAALAGCGGAGGGGVSPPSPPPPPALRTVQLGTAFAEAGFAVAVDNAGSLYVVGETAGNMDGQANAGLTDVFLVKFDSLGNRVFTALLGGPGHEQDPRVAVDSGGNVFVSGITTGLLDPGAASPGNGDLFVARLSPDNGAVLWLRQIGGVDAFGIRSVESDPSIAVDGDGNVYAACTTGGILDNAVKTGTGAGDGFSTDFALLKLDSLGNRLWTRQHGTENYETSAGIAVSPAGNVFVAGDSDGIMDTGTGSPGAGVSLDLFVARFLPDGSLGWVRQRGSESSELVFGIAVDNAGDSYMAGLTDGSMDNNTNAGTGTVDIFLVKIDDSGNWQYTVQSGTPADDIAFGVATDNAGNVYLAGTTTGDLEGTGNAGLLDAFLAKYDPAGAVRYVRQFGTEFEDSAFGLAVGRDGGVHITGFTNGGFDGNMNADPSNATPDGFVVLFDNDGVRLP